MPGEGPYLGRLVYLAQPVGYDLCVCIPILCLMVLLVACCVWSCLHTAAAFTTVGAFNKENFSGHALVRKGSLAALLVTGAREADTI